jgi:two-component sensor histidine kinase
MITALIRMEARNAQHPGEGERFNRLAGRVDALTILYRSLSDTNTDETVDLGTYVSQIASAVMAAHAVPGIRLDMKVDTWPVSVSVAMPVGLVVNELITNALKHAFKDREGGEVVLRCVVDATGCRISVSDNGVGLSDPADWPRRGKLSAMIVQSIKQNATARGGGRIRARQRNEGDDRFWQRRGRRALILMRQTSRPKARSAEPSPSPVLPPTPSPSR